MDSAPPRRGLGQGLALLLGEPHARAHGSLREIPIDQITPNPRQPRARIDEERFAELVESVRREGVVQPILVRGVAHGWELIAGERRWRAAQAAGLTSVPALVREADDRTSLALALVENICAPISIRWSRLVAMLASGRVRPLARRGRTAVGRSRTAVVNATRPLPCRRSWSCSTRQAERGPRPGAAADRGRTSAGQAPRAGCVGLSGVRQTEALARTRGRAARAVARAPRMVRRRLRERRGRRPLPHARGRRARLARPPAAGSRCAALSRAARGPRGAGARSTPPLEAGLGGSRGAPSAGFLVSSRLSGRLAQSVRAPLIRRRSVVRIHDRPL